MTDNDMVRAEIWLHDQLKQRPNIETLAHRLGYSVSQVRRNFKQHFGLTPGAYRDRLRLERAALLLGATENSIATIARECGYYNHPAFSRAFQRLFNCNPRIYRELFRVELAKRYKSNPQHFPFSIQQTPRRHALLARHYGYQIKTAAIVKWQQHARLPTLTQQDRLSKPFWILQDHPEITHQQRIRVDYGLLIDATMARELAPPLPFRIVELPACRYASVVLEDIHDVESAYTFLQAQGLPVAGERLNGAPATLTWLEGEPGDNDKSRIEICLPIATLAPQA